MTVSFSNEGAVVRAEYSDGTVDFVSKEGLNIIKTNAKYFTLKNPSFTAYYAYDQVTSPSSSDLDDLLVKLTTLATPPEDRATAPTSESSLERRDLFGTQIVMPMDVRLDVKSLFGVSLLRDRVAQQGGGLVENPVSASEYRLYVSSDGGLAHLRTRERGEYVAGVTAESGIGVRVTNDPFTGNQIFRWGYFDANNGMYFQKDANGLRVVIKRDGVVTLDVPQASWNVDSLDGNGPSHYTLDTSSGNIYHIMYTWYGYGAIAFKVVVKNGGNQFVQSVHIHAPDRETSIKSPNLPINAELSNENVTDPTTTTPIEAFVAGRQYSIIGNVDNASARVSNAYVLNASVPDDGAFHSILNVRRRANYIGNPVRILSFELLTNGTAVEQIRLNGVDFGSQTTNFAVLPDTAASETSLEQDTSATTVSGGVVLYNAFANYGQNKNAVTELTTKLEEDDAFNVCVRAFDGAITCSAIVRLQERW